MPLRGLTIVLASADHDRLRSALGMAAAQAALGGAARLFLDGPAAGLVEPPIASAGDDRHKTAGLPTLAQLVETALDLGVTITLCQTGLALAGISAEQVDLRFQTGGMTRLLATLGDDRLVAL